MTCREAYFLTLHVQTGSMQQLPGLLLRVMVNKACIISGIIHSFLVYVAVDITF